MLAHDRSTLLHVPPRIGIIERTNNSGTEIHYDLPSSVIAIGGRAEDASGELKKAAEALDEKLEKLIRSIV